MHSFRSPCSIQKWDKLNELDSNPYFRVNTYVLRLSIGHLGVVDLLLARPVFGRPVVLSLAPAEPPVGDSRSDHVPVGVVLREAARARLLRLVASVSLLVPRVGRVGFRPEVPNM